MPKKHRTRIPLENITRRPPWGATKAAAKKLQAERDHKNQIHDLTTTLAGQQVVIDNLIAARDKLRRQLDMVCDPKFMGSLRLVCAMTFKSGVDLGLVGALTDLVQWSKVLEGGVIENVRQTLVTSFVEILPTVRQ